jgi:signal transduction histidine kinase
MSQGRSRIGFSFRARLVVVMTALLLGSFAMVQYLAERAQREVEQALAEQKRTVDATFFAHVTAITQANNFALKSISNQSFIYELLELPEYQGVLDRTSIKHILVADEKGLITDASERELHEETIEVPQSGGSSPLGLVQKGDPAARLAGGDDDEYLETYWTRVETTRRDDGAKQVFWIAIVVSNAQVVSKIELSQRDVAAVVASTAMWQSRLTLGVFALAAALAILLVWRFTRPLQLLSAAAQRVANGDLDFSVDIRRRDEMGQLAETFNGMIGGLKSKAELEDRLNNAERAAVIGRLTSAIAHEIRNPLNFITLSIDHVRTKFPPTDTKDRERFDRLLGSVKEETGRLNRLVNDVLNFGRPASLNVRSVDLREIVDGIIGIVRTQAEEQGIEIETNLPDAAVMTARSSNRASRTSSSTPSRRCRPAVGSSSWSAATTTPLRFASRTRARAFRPRRLTAFSSHTTLRRIRGRAWGWPSPERSWMSTVGASASPARRAKGRPSRSTCRAAARVPTTGSAQRLPG